MVGFEELSTDDLGATNEAALRARATDPRLRVFANQVGNFGYHIDVGHVVIVPRAHPGGNSPSSVV
ncbi:MAG: hypothetical protein M3P83_02800, partial [Actinomycetota bacterium]|nr:hypothetical protein [Actinomycetota bacterium]